MFTVSFVRALPGIIVIVVILVEPVIDQVSKINCIVVTVALPSVEVLVGDGRQAIVLEVAATSIHCSNISQCLVPVLHAKK